MKTLSVTRDEIRANDFTLSVSGYITNEETKPIINPIEEELRVREILLSRLRKQLAFSKIVSDYENISLSPFLDAIEALIKEYRYKPIIRPK